MTVETLDLQATVIDAVQLIESSKRNLVVVLAGNGSIVGTLTDGDIRRHLLRGGTLDMPIDKAMNDSPAIAGPEMTKSEMLEALRARNILSLPLVDSDGRFVRAIHESELLSPDHHTPRETTFSCAVLMAGGEGVRLRPLTADKPKPMLEINGIPLLERQVRRLANSCVKTIYISINYLGDVIENHFGDGRDFSVNIEYLRESKKLGTAGALSLLPKNLKSEPLLVMNGDVLTTSDFSNLYRYHLDSQSQLTVGAVDYSVTIPYGVIESEGSHVVALREKPSQSFLCNAGIYAVSNQAIERIPNEIYWNMTDLINDCLKESVPVSVFPVHEYWSDVGTTIDLEKAREMFSKEDM
jgi:dTDP-glucose pyrophosphorylase